MIELTRIPNRIDAVLYKETLQRALNKEGIAYEAHIEEHYEDQYSEVILKVPESELEKAKAVKIGIIRKGPPTDE